MTKVEDQIRLFTLNSILIETDLRKVQVEIDEDIGHANIEHSSDMTSYFDTLPNALKIEANIMARHYVSFYCLENYIRQMIQDLLDERGQWWPDLVPEEIVKAAEKTHENEVKSGVTTRSDRMLDYLTFGQLSEVIKHNWKDCFETVFSDLNAVQRIMSDLNRLRGPIAHCCVLPDDEIGRLELAVKDLMRQL